jgi:hypothetical protein
VIDDIEQQLNELLAAWHSWADQDRRTAAGYPTSAAGCQMYRCSRQWDSINGAFDQDHDNAEMECLDFHVSCIPQPYRTAIAINARNLHQGLHVWRSARLPENDIERAQMVADAREKLVQRLQKHSTLLRPRAPLPCEESA